ncbi:unnamed protein product, partial [Mesorhabditis belari]|uniref:Uncharacterized protein n=1 Tax=Mesorhabditis belari TaxID=2138241 RepID=A0AAF3EF87_9BILA
MGTEKEIDTFMAIEKINSEVRMMDKTMEVKATLQAIKIQDMTKGALYTDLMAVHGSEEMLRFEFTQYQRTEVEKKAMAPTDRRYIYSQSVHL